MKERFLYEDTNPTIVLDPKRRLVATYTDLDARLQNRFPVIRVISDNLELIRGGVRAGQRLASVSVYDRNENSKALGRWANFLPIVVDCVSTDRAVCERAMAKIPASHWTALEIGLKQLPQPVRSGLYDIVLPDDLKRLL